MQEHCHRVIHYELPFNPNRMLKRQGRVDCFGQTTSCEFAFLYAADTCEGEVLMRLFAKIENQVLALGSVGDVLGALQADRIEQLLAQSPADVKAAIAEAERQIQLELDHINQQRNQELFGDQSPRQSSAKKPLKILAEIPARTVCLKCGLGRKQSGSYCTNRAFVDFLVREAKWQRAMELWDATPDPHAAGDENRDRGTAPVSVDAPAD